MVARPPSADRPAAFARDHEQVVHGRWWNVHPYQTDRHSGVTAITAGGSASPWVSRRHLRPNAAVRPSVRLRSVWYAGLTPPTITIALS